MISHGSALMAILKNVPMLQIMITVMNADCLRRKKMNKLDMSKEYSTRFDELRMNRVEVSYATAWCQHEYCQLGSICVGEWDQ